MIQESNLVFLTVYYSVIFLNLIIFNWFLLKKSGYLFFLTPPSFFTNAFFVMVMLWPVDLEFGAPDYFFRICLMTSFAIQTFLCCAYLKFTPQTDYKSFMGSAPITDKSSTQNLVIFILFVTLLTVLIAIAYEYTVGFSFLKLVVQKAGDEIFSLRLARHHSSGWIRGSADKRVRSYFIFFLA